MNERQLAARFHPRSIGDIAQSVFSLKTQTWKSPRPHFLRKVLHRTPGCYRGYVPFTKLPSQRWSGVWPETDSRPTCTASLLRPTRWSLDTSKASPSGTDLLSSWKLGRTIRPSTRRPRTTPRTPRIGMRPLRRDGFHRSVPRAPFPVLACWLVDWRLALASQFHGRWAYPSFSVFMAIASVRRARAGTARGVVVFPGITYAIPRSRKAAHVDTAIGSREIEIRVQSRGSATEVMGSSPNHLRVVRRTPRPWAAYQLGRRSVFAPISAADAQGNVLTMVRIVIMELGRCPSTQGNIGIASGLYDRIAIRVCYR